MLLRHSEVARAVRNGLLDAVQSDTPDVPALLRTSFPVTGQPVRVLMIAEEPWFAAVDVCRILGILNPSDVNKLLDRADTQTVNEWVVILDTIEGHPVPTGQSAYTRDPHQLNIISEAGLYTLIMKSRKPAAKPFQRWVTAELLPSIRRGDADFGRHRERMAESLSEAIGQQVHVLADMAHADARGIVVMSDGSVHCPHGEMEICAPSKAEDSGPPFGPSYRCPAVERVGIRGSRPVRTCGTVKLVDVVRRLAEPVVPASEPPAAETRAQPQPQPQAHQVRADTEPEAETEGMFLTIGGARVHGSPRQIAQILRDMGVVIKPGD
ncbi:Bro-N domain-containing protein [Streptomyces sp. NPDC091292]|uniref:BRO-N domain-containing protein n=1 Tax=Streptomyces sp. NPDC091292 TaxID=3365991 RepID=UPI0038156A18